MAWGRGRGVFRWVRLLLGVLRGAHDGCGRARSPIVVIGGTRARSPSQSGQWHERVCTCARDCWAEVGGAEVKGRNRRGEMAQRGVVACCWRGQEGQLYTVMSTVAAVFAFRHTRRPQARNRRNAQRSSCLVNHVFETPRFHCKHHPDGQWAIAECHNQWCESRKERPIRLAHGHA